MKLSGKIGEKFSKDGKEIAKYYCEYCKHEFEQKVGTFGSHERFVANNCVSSQVVCPKCGNFLKTWE